jgi:hypothetical protein
MDECIVDGCYYDAVPDGELCEEHEVLAEEEAWPDFHDEGEVW